jgi:hypothetical protein
MCVFVCVCSSRYAVLYVDLYTSYTHTPLNLHPHIHTAPHRHRDAMAWLPVAGRDYGPSLLEKGLDTKAFLRKPKIVRPAFAMPPAGACCVFVCVCEKKVHVRCESEIVYGTLCVYVFHVCAELVCFILTQASHIHFYTLHTLAHTTLTLTHTYTHSHWQAHSKGSSQCA